MTSVLHSQKLQTKYSANFLIHKTKRYLHCTILFIAWHTFLVALGGGLGVTCCCCCLTVFGFTLLAGATLPFAALGGGDVVLSSFSCITSCFPFLSFLLCCSFFCGNKLLLRLLVLVPHESAGLLDRLFEFFLLSFRVSLLFFAVGVAASSGTASRLRKVS